MELGVALNKLSLYIWTAILATLVYLVYRLVRLLIQTRKLRQALGQFPAEPIHWLHGHTHLITDMGDQLVQFLLDQVVKFPRVTHFWVGPFNPILRIQHPDPVKDVINNSDPKTTLMRTVLGPWLGDGLITTRGQKWFRNRRLITPAFHFDILKEYVLAENEAADSLIDVLQNHSETGTSVDAYHRLELCAFDIVLQCAFSTKTGCQASKETHPYVLACAELLELCTKRSYGNPLFYIDALYRLTSDGRQYYKKVAYVHSVADEVIAKRRKMLKEHGNEVMKKGKRQDFIDILLSARDEDGIGLTDTEIRDEANTFMFAGYDTVGSTMTWILYALAQNPEHQRKCQEEIDNLLVGRYSDWLKWEDLDQLKHLSMCMKEAQRLHNPVALINRTMEKEVVVDGKVVPAGTIVEIQLYSHHHNPKIWGDDHMEFKPERFLQENADKRDPFAFIPFSAGPRNCIGKVFAITQMKTVLSRILHRYTFRVDDSKPLQLVRSFILKPADGLYMHVERRR